MGIDNIKENQLAEKIRKMTAMKLSKEEIYKSFTPDEAKLLMKSLTSFKQQVQGKNRRGN
jgi:hypothetical protein